MPRLPLLALKIAFVISAHAASFAFAAQATQTRTWIFPDLPSTLRSQVDGAPAPAAATLAYPDDYQPGRRYPLLLWIEGGSGSTGLGPVGGGKLVDKSKYFRLSLPLFLPELEPLAPDNSNKWRRLYIGRDTAPFQAPIYSTMLKRVFADVPELQSTGNIAGGFSNGAHILAVLLSFPETAPVVTDRFDTFLFIEGGKELTPHPALQRHRFLVLQGAKWNPPWLDDLVNTMREAKLDVEYHGMPDVSHAFPEPEQRWVADWIAAHVKPQPTTQPPLRARIRR